MNRDMVFARISKFLAEDFDIPADKITADAHLFKDLQLDSIDALDMMALLEDELNVSGKDEELAKLRTVEDVVQFVLRNGPSGETVTG